MIFWERKTIKMQIKQFSPKLFLFAPRESFQLGLYIKTEGKYCRTFRRIEIVVR
jgi:hypothetical protein